jgi:hypothetical protein
VPPPHTTAAAAIASRYGVGVEHDAPSLCHAGFRSDILFYFTTTHERTPSLNVFLDLNFVPTNVFYLERPVDMVGLCCLRMEIFSISFM